MYLGLLSEGARLPADYWRLVHPAASRVEIEIGPGDCAFIAATARERPDTLFVGLELRRSAVDRVLASASLPENAKLYLTDGRWIVEHLFADESVDAYHVYFPDPWWKKRHRKRGLFTVGFAGGVARTLKPGCALLLVTDVERLFRDAVDRLADSGLTIEQWSPTGTDGAAGAYERKYRREGRTLYSALCTKRA